MNYKRKRSNDIYEVQKIIGKKIKGKTIHYKVKWKGYKAEDSTWEPIENLVNVRNLIQKYEKRIELKKSNSLKRIVKIKDKEPSMFCINTTRKANQSDDNTVSNSYEETKTNSLLGQDNNQQIGINPKILISLQEDKIDAETITNEKDFLLSNKPIVTERITELEPFGNDIIALVLEENDKMQKVREKAINISELRHSNPKIVIDYFVSEYLQRHNKPFTQY